MAPSVPDFVAIQAQRHAVPARIHKARSASSTLRETFVPSLASVSQAIRGVYFVLIGACRERPWSMKY